MNAPEYHPEKTASNPLFRVVAMLCLTWVLNLPLVGKSPSCLALPTAPAARSAIQEPQQEPVQPEAEVDQVEEPDSKPAAPDAPIERDANGAEEKDESRESPPFKFEKHGAIVFSKTADYRLTLDVYQPQGSGPFPVVLAIHGGAWRGGSKIAMTRHAWLLARSGYVVVAINYRFAPEYPFPAQVEDCKQAVRWIRFHARQYRMDPERVVAFGYSAGGHLAAMLASTDEQAGLEGPVDDPRLRKISTRVQAAICGGGVYDFHWIAPDNRILAYWLGDSPQQRPDVYRRAAPISHVTSDDPPMFLYHGAEDLVVPVETARHMAQTLEKAQVPSRLVEVAGKGHIQTFVDLSIIPRAIEFLKTECGLDLPDVLERIETNQKPITRPSDK